MDHLKIFKPSSPLYEAKLLLRLNPEANLLLSLIRVNNKRLSYGFLKFLTYEDEVKVEADVNVNVKS